MRTRKTRTRTKRPSQRRSNAPIHSPVRTDLFTGAPILNTEDMSTTFYKESVPTWALCALINGDLTGLEDEDITLVEKWLKTTGYTVISPDESEPYFSPFPAFGLATDCIDCWCK